MYALSGNLYVHKHTFTNTHCHPDTAGHWLWHQVTQYQVLIYLTISRPQMLGQATSDEIQRTEPQTKQKKREEKNACHYVSILKCVKQKLWNADRLRSQKKDFSTACSSCWMSVMFNPAVFIFLHGSSMWNWAKPISARISSQQYILPDQPGLPPGVKRTKEIKQKKETCKQSW